VHPSALEALGQGLREAGMENEMKGEEGGREGGREVSGL